MCTTKSSTVTNTDGTNRNTGCCWTWLMPCRVQPENNPYDPSKLNLDIMTSKMEFRDRAAIIRTIVTKKQKHIIWSIIHNMKPQCVRNYLNMPQSQPVRCPLKYGSTGIKMPRNLKVLMFTNERLFQNVV